MATGGAKAGGEESATFLGGCYRGLPGDSPSRTLSSCLLLVIRRRSSLGIGSSGHYGSHLALRGTARPDVTYREYVLTCMYVHALIPMSDYHP